MNCTLKNMTLASCLVLAQGCTALGTSNSFTVTADLPPEFTYEATATYVPAKGETCTVPGERIRKLATTRGGKNMNGIRRYCYAVRSVAAPWYCRISIFMYMVGMARIGGISDETQQ